MHYLGIILASIVAYLIGSISWSIIIVRWRRGIDIRTTGSGNAGATNTTRLLGKAWGLAVVFLDGLKVVFAALFAVVISLIPSPLFSETSYFIPAIFVLVGHCWPIYYKFKGGKAVATFLGLLLISNVWYLLIFLAAWFIVAAISRRVSVASIFAAIAVGIAIWFPWLNGIDSFIWQWNGYETWWTEAWHDEWLRFSWVNYLHVPVYNFTSSHGYHGQPFASGMLEIQIINLIGGFILLIRHFPNMVRIKNKAEPETFPKLTEAEKKELYRLQHQPRPTREERKELVRLEKIAKLEAKTRKINEKIERINRK